MGLAHDSGVDMSKRTDIQGLRALAVVLVVTAHSFGVPYGGYVGVDVFYVISGFLITGILIKEMEASGSLSFSAFYRRRMRRLLPAGVTVLAVTVIAAFCLWFIPRALQTLLDAASALFFAANWHFQALGTDYLQAAKPVSPVQHYWSLSVEEQFYVVWPLFLFVLYKLFRGSRAKISVVAGVIALCSLAWSVWGSVSSPAAAYFDTFGRAWELLIGAMIALASGVRGRRRLRMENEGLRVAITWAGLLLIVVPALAIDQRWTAPFPAVVLPVLGTATVIVASSYSGPRSLLGNPVSQWLGKVSYSLYLWHFPVIVFAHSVWGAAVGPSVLALLLMLVLSAISHRFLEAPFQGHRGRRSRRNRPPRAAGPHRELLIAGGAFIAILVLSFAQLQGPGAARDASALVKLIGRSPVSVQTYAESAGAREAELVSSLRARSWTAPIRGQLDGLFADQLPPEMSTKAPGCRNDVAQGGRPRLCGDPTPGGVLVVGDSVALSWVPAIREAFRTSKLNVAAVGYASCPLVEMPGVAPGGESFNRACGTRRQEMLSIIDSTRPDVVVLSSAQSYLESPGASPAAWQKGTASLLTRLSHVPKVILLSNPPRTVFPDGCATRVTGPSLCTAPVEKEYLDKSGAERAAVSGHSNAIFVDTESWFCSDGQCPLVIGGNVSRTDNTHLTDASSKAVGPLLRAILASRSSGL